jgi:orotate phosphoribosyltransferase
MNTATLLLKHGAVSLKPASPFRYTSGILSPIYCDNRILLTDPASRNDIVNFFIKIIEKNNIEFDVIGGVATAGIAWGALIADKLNKNFIYVRSEKKEHGKQNVIEGKLISGQKVLVIEDLISTGGSSIKAVENIREAGGIVNDCLAIFSYGMEKSKEAFEDAKCRIITLSNLSELIDEAIAQKTITSEQKEIILDWINNTAEWGKKHGFE